MGATALIHSVTFGDHLRATATKLRRLVAGSPRFRFGGFGLFALFLCLVAALQIKTQYDTANLNKEASGRVDAALASNIPSYGSLYCRWVFQEASKYDSCVTDEQKSYSRFDEAWHRTQSNGVLRDQMIRCLSAAQNGYGMSWKQAADCADLNEDASKTTLISL